MINRRKAFRDKYLAAAMVLIALLFASLHTSAQVGEKKYQEGNNYYQWKAGLFPELIGIPADTFAIPTNKHNYPHIAVKGGVLYMWNTTLYKWAPATGANGNGPYVFVSPLHNDGSGIISIQGWNGTAWDSVLNVIRSTYKHIDWTAVSEWYKTNPLQHYYTKDQADSMLALYQRRLLVGPGLSLVDDSLNVAYANPIWNAGKWKGLNFDFSDTTGKHGYVPKWNSVTKQFEWGQDNDGGSGSADGNNYLNSIDFDIVTGNLTLGRQGMGSISKNLDGRYLQAFAEADPTFQLGLPTQYYKGDKSLGNFNTDVYGAGDSRYVIGNFSDGRIAFGSPTGLTHSPRFRYNDAAAQLRFGGSASLRYPNFFFDSSGVLKGGMTADMVTGDMYWDAQKVHHFRVGTNTNGGFAGPGVATISGTGDFSANGHITAKGTTSTTDTNSVKPTGMDAAGRLYKLPHWYGSGGGLTAAEKLRLDSAIYKATAIAPNTTRFWRFNGGYVDQVFLADTANALWHISANSGGNHIYTKAHRIGLGTTAPVAGVDLRGVFDLTFPAVQIKDSTSPGGYMWLSDGSNVDGRFSASIIGKNAGDSTVANRNGLSLVGIPGMDSSIHSAVSIDGRMEYSPFSYSTLTKAKLLRIANNQVEKLHVTIDGGIWSHELNDNTGIDKQLLVNNGKFKLGGVPGSGNNGSGGSVNLKRQQWKNGTATTYTLTSTYSGSFAAVFYNGLELDSDDYTITGTTLTLLFTPETSDRISIHYSY